MTIQQEPLCSAPFKNIRISMINLNRLVYRPCCNYVDYNIAHKNVNDYVQSTELANLRTQMHGNELPRACSTCIKEESTGQNSLRQMMNQNNIPMGQDIAQLEVFPNNTCNLRCFMCNPASSSSLAAEHKALGWLSNYNEVDTVDQTITDIQALPNLHTVSFIGGEFFLAKRATEILELVRDRGLAVRLVTNATILLPQHMEQLQHIKDLELQISIDATKAAYEFMRYPADWNTVHANIIKLKQGLPQAKLNFNFVVQPLNIAHVVSTMEYANSVRIPMRLTNLQGPLWLNWHILTKEEKQALHATVEAQLVAPLATKQKTQVIDILKIMHSCEYKQDHRYEFKRRMSSLMAHRKIAYSVVCDHFAALPSLGNFTQSP